MTRVLGPVRAYEAPRTFHRAGGVDFAIMAYVRGGEMAGRVVRAKKEKNDGRLTSERGVNERSKEVGADLGWG